MAYISQIAVNQAAAYSPVGTGAGVHLEYFSVFTGISGSLYTKHLKKYYNNVDGNNNICSKKAWLHSPANSMDPSHHAPVPWFSSVIERGAEKGSFIKNIPWIHKGLVHYICCHWSGACSIFSPVWERTMALVRINKYRVLVLDAESD